MGLFKNNKVKIVLCLVVSFFFTAFLSKTVFLASTPRINPFLGSKIRNLASLVLEKQNSLISSLSLSLRREKTANQNTFLLTKLKSSQVKILPKISFRPISKSVYAGIDKKAKVQYITIKKGTKVEVKIYRVKMSNGKEKEIKVIIPIEK